jgi:VWFA-related protein
LESALDLLETPEMQRASDDGSGQRHHGGGTLLYDAVYLASNDMMEKMQGRKALIILSDGVDHGSKESLPTAIESAQRANTIVYSILFKDDEPFGGHGGYGGGGWGGHGGYGGGHRFPQEERPDGKKVLERISKETGGRVFEVSKKQTADQIYDQISQELREQYVLGYVPDKSLNTAGYHKIHLVAKQKDLAVQARDGYYAEQPASATNSQ